MTYFPHSENEINEMLSAIGIKNLDDLKNSIPLKYQINKLNIKEGKSELEANLYFNDIAKKNKNYNSIFLGAGAYNHYIPAAVDEILSRQEFYTAYTPYQAEISQGTLQALFEYQTYICRLTGMDVSNASMYDGATALAESIIIAHRITNKNKVLIDKYINPEYLKVLYTYLNPLNIDIIIYQSDPFSFSIENFKKSWESDFACFVISSPNFFGSIIDFKEASDIIHSDNKLIIQCITEALSLSILKKPSFYNVDIVCGEAQSFGIPLSFGGPYLGFIAVVNKFLRKMPGRIVGQSTDKDQNIAYTLTISAREQHIRRENATSNICSNHSLNAIKTAVYLSLLGEKGLSECGISNLENAHILHENIGKLNNFSVNNEQVFFNEFIVNSDIEYTKINKALEEKNILSFLPLNQNFNNYTNSYLLCATEMNSDSQIDEFIKILGSIK